MAFDVKSDGTLGASRVLYDGTRSLADRWGTADGLKVDASGNIFGVGPGGVYVFAPDGAMLGWFDFGGNVGNVAWGEDGSSLFIAANARVPDPAHDPGGRLAKAVGRTQPGTFPRPMAFHFSTPVVPLGAPCPSRVP
jgi:sugar lactone lactonase YvrE